MRRGSFHNQIINSAIYRLFDRSVNITRICIESAYINYEKHQPLINLHVKYKFKLWSRDIKKELCSSLVLIIINNEYFGFIYD